MKNFHKKYLLKAHLLANENFGKTFPNPSVGCLIVKNNKIISKAATASAGRPHAEEIAIKKAGKKSTGKRGKKSADLDDSGIVVIDDDLKVDTEKELEERRAYLEEARSQDSGD